MKWHNTLAKPNKMYTYYSVCLIVMEFQFSMASPKVCRTIDSGCVCGSIRVAEEGVKYESYRGIPYAKPPLRELRFAAPESVTPWKRCLKATEDGPVCPQYDELFGLMVDPQRGMSEDCLLINVHVPLNATIGKSNRGLPVFTFIHGGGFQAGSGNSDLYGPEYLIRNNIIVVTFNYRLAMFGFLSIPSSKIQGNAGLRDVLNALQWVKTNAAVFGGNPNDVTLAGQSTGATLAHLITLSTPAKGLFKRAMLMSGTAMPSFYTTSRAYADVVANQFVQLLGINSTDADTIHNELINMPLDKILQANQQIQKATGLIAFAPVVETSGDTKMVEDDPINLIKAGRDKDTPLIIGFSSNEAIFAERRLKYLNIVNTVNGNPLLVLSPRLIYAVSSSVGQALATQVINQYFNGSITLSGYLNLTSDTYFVYPALKVAQWRAALNASTYLYQFSYDSTFNVVKSALMLNYEGGGAHGEDLTNIFRVNALQGDRKAFPPISRDDLMKYWMTEFVTNFINCSQPYCGNASLWPATNATALNYQDLRDPMDVATNVPAPQPTLDMIQFWDSIEETAKNITSF